MKFKRLLLITFIIALSIALIAVLMSPSDRDKRRSEDIAKRADWLNTASQDDWNKIFSGTGFNLPFKRPEGHLTIFMPTTNYDLLELEYLVEDALIDVNVKIVPLPSEEFKTEETLLKLCMAKKWDWKYAFDQQLSATPDRLKAWVNKEWSEVHMETRKEIDGQLAKNQRIYEGSGEFACYLSLKGKFSRAKSLNCTPLGEL